MPLVQHALLSLLEQVKHGRLSLTQVVEKTAHNPALRYGVADRGYIREGYYADLVLVNEQATTAVTRDNTLYQCGWSPFEGETFSSQIVGTWVNGRQVYSLNGLVADGVSSMPLVFSR